MEKQKYSVQRKPYFRVVKWFLRLFIRKPKIITKNKTLDPNAIYISNHAGASAPVKHELYFPHNFKFWGTHEMVFSYSERFNYLAYNYLPKKKHINKTLSKVLAAIILPFVSLFYRGIELIPTFTDSRLLQTIHYSLEYLKAGNSIIIFPENSSDGYHDILTEYFGGFLFLAKYYYKKTKHNIKIYNMYFCKEKNTLVIDEPVTVEKIMQDKRDIRDIANDFCHRANELRSLAFVKPKKN